MSDFRIDPTRGPHAAADLSDDEVEYLCKLVLWELSMRTTMAEYEEFLTDLSGIREELDDLICEARKERDQMEFKASVLADLEELPLVSSHGSGEPPTGMYL